MGTIVLKMSQIRVRKITQLARQSKSVRSFATSGAASKIATKILKRVTDTVGTAPVQANENIDLSELRTLNNLEKMKENKDLSPSVNPFVKNLLPIQQSTLMAIANWYKSYNQKLIWLMNGKKLLMKWKHYQKNKTVLPLVNKQKMLWSVC